MDTPLGKGLESLIPDRQPGDVPSTLSSAPAPLQQDPIIDPATELPSAPVLPELPQPERIAELPPAPVPQDAPLTSMLHTEQISSSAIPAARSYQDHFASRKTDSIFWIEIEKIEPNPFQPRREFAEEALNDLAGSIREYGLLQPVLVTKKEVETPTGLRVTYELIAGERRWRASKIAGLSQIPAVIRRGVPDDRLKLELAIIENVQREELNAIERARAFKQLIDEFHLMQREIASRVGKSREMVANTLRLLALPPDIQQAINVGQISEGHGRAVLMAGDDTQKQFEVYQAIVSDRLSVREAENRARQVGGRTFTPRKRASKIDDPEMRQWQNRLQEEFGTKVHLQRIGERGKIVVEFFSEEELRGLLHKLVKEG
ncbi:MAG: ParB/RepB/Spo0J family partition protein [bacterium]|nr:ParB/RepB/Spo0J family partition protein [bacterium]